MLCWCYQSFRLCGYKKDDPDHFYLVPGVGAQGGSLEDVGKCS